MRSQQCETRWKEKAKRKTSGAAQAGAAVKRNLSCSDRILKRRIDEPICRAPYCFAWPLSSQLSDDRQHLHIHHY